MSSGATDDRSSNVSSGKKGCFAKKKVEGAEGEGEEENYSRRDKYAEYNTLQIPRFILLPYKGFIPKWEALMVLAAVYYNIRVPMQLAFSNFSVGMMFILDYLVDFTILLDIVVRFRTAFFHNGNLIVDKKAIAKDYIKSSFILDVLAFIPLDLLVFFAAIANKTEDGLPGLNIQNECLEGCIGLMRVMPWFRATRLLRSNRMVKWANGIEKNLEVNAAMLRFVKFLFVILVLTHWLGCLWFVLESSTGFAGLSGSWDMNHLEDLASMSVTEMGFQDQLTRLLKAWNWALSTLTSAGTEDYFPVTKTEYMFQIVCTMLGASVYAGFIGNLAGILSDFNSTSAHFRQKMEHVKHYLNYRQIPNELKERVFGYYEYLWSRHNGLDENVILNDLPQQLRVEVALNVARKSVEAVFTKTFIKGVKKDFIRRIVVALQPKHFTPGDWIVRQGEIGNDMYFVNAGYVEVISENFLTGQSTVISILRSSQYFGERALLTAEVRGASVKAASFCDLFQLTRGDLNRILQDYPEYKIAMLNNAKHVQMSEAQREKIVREKLIAYVSLLAGNTRLTKEEKSKIGKRKITAWIKRLRKDGRGIYRPGHYLQRTYMRRISVMAWKDDDKDDLDKDEEMSAVARGAMGGQEVSTDTGGQPGQTNDGM